MARRPEPHRKTESDAKSLDTEIDGERNGIRTDKIDLSYGELASMYEDGELIISPEYQRLFRWTEDKKANFIESLLLGFPIPAIFVAEGENAVWELVDGLQRLSTVFEFMGVLKAGDGSIRAPLRLSFADRDNQKLSRLHGFTFDELSLRSRLTLKRTYCRVEVIKIGSATNMKYDVFERLNTGGTRLEPQEIRNAIFRASDPEFMTFCDRLATKTEFNSNLLLSDNQVSQMYDRGLVLRFFTLKNNYENFDHDVEPFITSYTKKIVSRHIAFDQGAEEALFTRTFGAISRALGDEAWRHRKDGRSGGAFSVYVFDALSIGVAKNIGFVETLGSDDLRARCINVKESAAFRESTGAGGNTQAKMRTRLDTAIDMLGHGDASDQV